MGGISTRKKQQNKFKAQNITTAKNNKTYTNIITDYLIHVGWAGGKIIIQPLIAVAKFTLEEKQQTWREK